jgi:molybdopterin molybdotransferase
MISFNEAYQIVLEQTKEYGSEMVPLKNALGRVLMVDILADRDFPPFNRATKDGIAINYDAVEHGRRSFEIKGTLPAGKPTIPFVDAEGCIEIMTGAMVPYETDTVIMYEDVEIAHDIATITKIPNRGQNIHLRGSDEKKGAVLIKKNTRITSAEIGVLATVGKHTVSVKKMPRVAVISTGNELVDVDQQPLNHQIRKSNSYSLYASLLESGITPMLLHISDDKDLLRQKLGYVIEEMDVLLLSGGVSKGKFDFIPQIFKELGVEKLFHKVAQRPGKPFWFGTKESSGTLIFSFPGNPVSTFMNFYIYFRPWLYRSLGITISEYEVCLKDTLEIKNDLTNFLGVQLERKEGRNEAALVGANGSGDLLSLSKMDGFIRVPSTKRILTKGDRFYFISTREGY